MTVPDLTDSSLQCLLHTQVKKKHLGCPKGLSLCHSLTNFQLFWKELPLIPPPTYLLWCKAALASLVIHKCKIKDKRMSSAQENQQHIHGSFTAITSQQNFHQSVKSLKMCKSQQHLVQYPVWFHSDSGQKAPDLTIPYFHAPFGMGSTHLHKRLAANGNSPHERNKLPRPAWKGLRE